MIRRWNILVPMKGKCRKTSHFLACELWCEPEVIIKSLGGSHREFRGYGGKIGELDELS